MSSPSSIKDLVPLDISGRHARKGFIYQDHIAAGFCISFLSNPALKEIWLESHDDILLFWEKEEILTIEFVQVKAIDQLSRWSIASICGSGKPSDSIVKKLMDQDRCKESVLFRVVSSYDVSSELALLKHSINSIERNNEVTKELELSKEIEKKLGALKSPNGKTIHDWIKLCWWEKRQETVDDLMSNNKISLEGALESFGMPIMSDQRDEIYQKILSYCQAASTNNIGQHPGCYKITKQEFIDWLTKTIDVLYTPSSGMGKLEEKLSKAMNVPSDYIPGAKQLKWDYLKQRYNNDFIQSSEMQSLEKVIHGELFKMRLALDNDELDEENFHKLCVDKLDIIKNSPVYITKNIPNYLLLGFMYDLAGKCLHRFRKVEP